MSAIDKLKNSNAYDFAVACYDLKSLDELKEAKNRKSADKTDLKTWGISANEWKNAIAAALEDKIEHELQAIGDLDYITDRIKQTIKHNLITFLDNQTDISDENKPNIVMLSFAKLVADFAINCTTHDDNPHEMLEELIEIIREVFKFKIQKNNN